jgi:hypothetical protein|tara:strand:+ start:8795 stop:8950 length:156 start_codon:yes stop_codon:yes gene_type:complete
MWTLLGFAGLIWFLANQQRQIDEISEHVKLLHSDVRDEIYTRYGERFDGKK